jgi:hypothetical protein
VKKRGNYKIANRQGALEELLHPALRGERRIQRILESLRSEIAEGGAQSLRIRRILSSPREIFRLEIELPELGYQRTTLLDRETLEELLAADELKHLLPASALSF